MRIYDVPQGTSFTLQFEEMTDGRLLDSTLVDLWADAAFKRSYMNAISGVARQDVRPPRPIRRSINAAVEEFPALPSTGGPQRQEAPATVPPATRSVANKETSPATQSTTIMVGGTAVRTTGEFAVEPIVDWNVAPIPNPMPEAQTPAAPANTTPDEEEEDDGYGLFDDVPTQGQEGANAPPTITSQVTGGNQPATSYAAAIREGTGEDQAQTEGQIDTANLPESFSWGDLLSLDATARAERVIAQAAGKNLISLLRSKGKVQDSGQVLVPDNLGTAIACFHQSFKAVATAVGLTFALDAARQLGTSYKNCFSEDSAIQKTTLGAIPGTAPEVEKIKEALETVSIILGAFGEGGLPTIKQLATAKGNTRFAVTYLMLTQAGMFVEQHEHVSIAAQRPWYKHGEDVRKIVLEHFIKVFGEKPSAECLLSAVETVLRRYIRSLFAIEVTKRTIVQTAFIAGVAAYTERLTISGPELFKKVLRKVTLEKRAKIPNRAPGARVEWAKRKVTTILRPSLIDGPKTADEEATSSRLNKLLNNLESRTCPSFTYKTHATHASWQRGIEVMRDKAYARTDSYAKMMASRRADLRAVIDTNRTNNAVRGIALQPGPRLKATPLEYTTALATLVATNAEKWEPRSITALQNLFNDKGVTYALIRSWSDAEIIERLIKSFTVG
jgi:hypothetical protein